MNLFTIKHFQTANLYFAFVVLGMALAITGPTLLDLELALNTDTEHISYIIVGRGIGYLSGSFVGGLLFDRFNREVLFLINLLFLVITITAAPWCRNLILLIAIMVIEGLVLGAIDTGGNCWCLHLWGKENGPYYQALHFSFGVGTFIAPLLAEPFLSRVKESSETLNMTNSSAVWEVEANLSEKNDTNTFLYNNLFSPAGLENHDRFQVFGFEYAFIVIGAFTFFCVNFVFCCFCVQKHRNVPVQTQKAEGSQKVELRVIVFILTVCTIFMIFYAGLEVTYGQMIATFVVVGPLKLSKSKGSFITSFYWGTYTFARGVAIFISMKLSSFVMLMIDIFIVLGASLLLVIFVSSSEEILWAASGLLGIGMASIYPSIVSWCEKYIVMTNKVTSTFVVTTSLGETVLPLLVGHYIEHTPMFLMYVMLSGIICAFLAFLVIWQFVYRQKSKYNIDERNMSKGENNHFETVPTKVTLLNELAAPEDSNKVEGSELVPNIYNTAETV
ncbi:LOW QUALITY PROTEIN: sodium-dependent glucose transporter 1A-like [Tachypleus tridentatus]|uniref:LOW QUALITY PROTEIN: sodium-dependent glucose transporter 1A-like n=1 Tax=Tachypleus tridentatus TaxID=6853 RepID=UPI003FCF0430